MEETAARPDDTVEIPDTAWTLEGFRAWALSRVDARGRREIRFEIRTLEADGYRPVEPDAEGWVLSPFLEVRFRLRRLEPRPGRWNYRLDHEE